MGITAHSMRQQNLRLDRLGHGDGFASEIGPLFKFAGCFSKCRAK